MRRICSKQIRISATKLSSVRACSGLGESAEEASDIAKRLYKVLMSTPPAVIDTALDQTGVRVSQDVVQDVLERFRNGGMLAYRFFEWAGKQRNYEHSIRAYHSLIDSMAKIRQFKIMWDLVNAMRSKKILNTETFCIIMRKYARAQKLDEAVYTFNVMDKHGVPPNLPAFNALLSALCKSKNVAKAQEIFDCMKDRFRPDSKTYSILLEGWGKAPNLPKAREVFREMVGAGCAPDIVTYCIMVDVLCKAGRVDEALGIVKTMDPGTCKPNSFIYSVLVHTYGVENRIEDAVYTFLELERNGIETDVVVYNALISAFCKANKFKNAYKVLNEMEIKRVTANSRTYNILLSSLLGCDRTDEASILFRRTVKVCRPDADTYTMMIKMYCEKGNLEMALKLWRYIKGKSFVPSMHTFSVLINGLCDKQHTRKACVLVEEMIEMGIRPSSVTFGRLRKVLLKEGRDDVLKFLQEKMNLLVKEPLFD